MPISTNAPFNEFGQSQILRDIEQLYLALNGAGDGGAGDGQTQDQTAVTSQDSGGLPDLSGLATISYVNAVAQNILNSIPVVDTTVGGDLSGTYDNATVVALQGNAISASAPSADEQALLWNSVSSWWEPVTLVANNGGLLTKDAGGLIEIAGGTALSVVGNATNTAGSINAVAAAADNTLLGRRSSTLTWAKVARAEQADGTACTVIGRSANSTGVVADITAAADNTLLGRRSSTLTWAKVARAEQADGSACSVIGRAANSTGVVADITASADGQVLQRLSGSVQFAAFSGLPAAPSGAGWVLTHDGSSAAWDQTVALGNTSAAGSLTIANATSASAVVISPTLVNAVGKILSIREIDVCDAGVAKKMLVLASAPY